MDTGVLVKRNHEHGQEFLKQKQGKHTGNRWSAVVDHWDFLFTLKKKPITDTLHIGIYTYTHSENQDVSEWLGESYSILHFICIYLCALWALFVCLILFSGFK